MRPVDWERAACQVAGRDLSRRRWDQLVGKGVAYHATCAPFLQGVRTH